MNYNDLVGEYNNFQQYWGENTEEEIHKVESAHSHRHLHLMIGKIENSDSAFELKLYKGRDKTSMISEHKLEWVDDLCHIDNSLVEGKIDFRKGCLYLSGLGILEDCDSDVYKFLPCRYFSGWIQYPPDMDNQDDLYSQRDLEMHDQGGIVELDVDGVDYAVELTQLVYSHTIKVMKLAVYDMPMSEVNINSKSICYTWSNPEVKRLGINIRKVISGWTLIEPDYINSNQLNRNT